MATRRLCSALFWTTGVTVSVRDRLPLKMHFLDQVVLSSAEIAGLPRGDNQVQVHVIEARDLKGRKQAAFLTRSCSSTSPTSAGTSFEKLQSISVYHKERVIKNNIIGIYQLGYISVYV
ncbi:hypothetical protein PF011_g31604 [Phytophthora fragariae]|uniref:Uncharacterized protein n=3 Tax=Phytophthora fragariae TaxID=53985 RepID=A0A6A3GHX5_9STRA|nr:hypothetical protein PF011_g31604 [Phytophthora fragariae]